MNCPQCNARIAPRHLPDETVSLTCGQCGWGRQGSIADADADGDDAGATLAPGRPATFWLKLTFFWALTLLVLVGPYVGLRYAAGYVAGEAGLADGTIEARFVAALNLHYAWVMAVYLVLCWLMTPSYDRQNMGLFGAGLAGNPAITREHHYNRTMHSLATLVAPGKVVLATAAATWRLLRR